ncbi:MAG TPA: Gfo/Idh/MocA family oxidoreductase [bacterium]|nr:Gfo/Idh/MocA family oxidoreductase [bacterium]
MNGPVSVAVVGVGYLGRFHAQKYAALPHCKLVGVVDPDSKRAQDIGKEVGVPAFGHVEEVLPRVDAVSVVVPTAAHYAVARTCLLAGKHALVEKPLAATVAEAQELVTLAGRRNVVLQVGYLERFNPAFLACKPRIGRPTFVEALRIHSFLERGSDVDVVLDLMSHDLDLVLSLMGSPVRDLHAVGLSLMTARTDLANVRLIFENGGVANLTASRISRKAERKLRLFQQDSYFSMDFQQPAARVYTAGPQPAAKAARNVMEEVLDVHKGDALLAEIESFLQAVRTRTAPAVTGEDALKAMLVADRIMRDIERNQMP